MLAAVIAEIAASSGAKPVRMESWSIISQSPIADGGGGGSGGFTVNVAVIVAGEPWAPLEVTVACPV